MKILFLGDSITDMHRNRETEFFYDSYGFAYPLFVEGELAIKYPKQFEVLNKGISGNRVVDLYSRIKIDCWNHKPDVVSIFIGVNDVWHGLFEGIGNGVDIERFEKVYRMLIDDTKKALPCAKFILVAPFFLEGSATNERMDEFVNICKKNSRHWQKITVLHTIFMTVFTPLLLHLKLSLMNGLKYLILT